MKHNINKWIFEIPLQDVISDKYPEVEPLNHCLLCGKHIKQENYYVHLLTNGNLVSTNQQFSSQEDQGFFSIGNECKNKLPNNFVFKL